MWPFRRRDNVSRLSSDLSEFVRERFHLRDEQIVALRYRSKPGYHLNRRVSLVKIFAPESIDGAVPEDYDGLDAHQQAVWFQGYVLKGGAIYLADRRPMRAVHRRGGTASQPGVPTASQATSGTLVG